MGLGAVEQVGPTAQLLLKHGPERRLWTQNLETVDPGVNASLSEGGEGRSADGGRGAGGRDQETGWSSESHLLTSLDPDLDDGPEPGHVLQEDDPTGRRGHVNLRAHTAG